MAGTDGVSIGQVTPVLINASSFVNHRGQKLHTSDYLPGSGTPLRAVLIWHHGIGEYIDRHRKVFCKLAEAGIAVCGFDAHGHGLSEPSDQHDRWLVWSFQHLVDDNLQHLANVQQRYSGQPMFIGGNSLGSLVAMHTVARSPNNTFAGLLMQSALVDVEWTMVLRMQAPIGGLLATLAARARLVPAVRPEDMSQDPDVVNAYKSDPLINKGNVRARTANEVLKGFKATPKIRPALTLPIYAVHGDHDRTTSLSAVQKLLEAVPSKDVQLVIIKGGYHELLQGPETEEVLTGMINWLTAHLTGAQPAASTTVDGSGVTVSPGATSHALDARL